MKLAQHVTDRTRRFLVLGSRRQAEFGHGIDDAPLHRFQTVTDMRQCAVENDIHGIIQVGLLGKGLQRQSFYAFIIEFECFHRVHIG